MNYEATIWNLRIVALKVNHDVLVKAWVKNMIEDILDSLSETYDDDLWPKTCSVVYLHIFEKYPGQGEHVNVQ